MAKSYGPLDNAILRHHFEALARNRILQHLPPDVRAGMYSTLLTKSFGTPSGEMIIPTVWDGKELSNQAAMARALQSGEHWPTFPTDKAAQKADEDYHGYLHQMGGGPGG
jgi:hypothetical protein